MKRFILSLLTLLAIGASAQAETSYTDRLEGLISSQAIKAPVKVATTANITLSGAQTIDGVSIVAGDRVLVKDQTDTTENGIYTAATGEWNRSSDFDGARDITTGTIVIVNSGTVNSNSAWKVSTSGTITIGTSNITFSGAYVAIPTGLSASSLTLSGAATVGTTLGVTGATTLSSTLGVTATATLSSALNVAGATALSGVAAIGTTTSNDRGLVIGNSSLTGSSQYGTVIAPTFSSTATAAGYAVFIQPSTANSSFTQTANYGVYIANPSKGSSSTITTAYGIYLENITSGSANWGIYSTGTATKTYLAGDIFSARTTPIAPASNTTRGLYFESALGKLYVATDITNTLAPLVLQRTATIGNAISFFQGNNNVGNVALTATNTTYSTTSDERLKENPVPITDAGTILDQTNPVRFTWKKQGSQGVGFYAQELYTAIPEAVTVGGDELDQFGYPISPWGVDHSKIIPYLVAEIKSLRARVYALENK